MLSLASLAVASDVAAQSVCNGFGPDRLGHIREGICLGKGAAIDTRSAASAWESCQRAIPGCVVGDCHLAIDICKGVAAARGAWPDCTDQNRGKPIGWVEFYPAGEQRKGACLAAKGLVCPTAGDAVVREVCQTVKKELASPPPPSPTLGPPPQPPQVQQQAKSPANIGAPQKDGRLRGIADLHMHLMSNLGFGGDFLFGSVWDTARPCNFASAADLVNGAPCAEAHALSRCDAVHQPLGINIISPDGIRHGTEGYPSFDSWPKSTGVTHQRAYVTWLKRAWQLGGLRLMVMQAVNSEVLCDTMGHHASCRGMDAVQREIDGMRAFERRIAQTDGGWLHIVTTPNEARETIAQGKLAIVLGIEIETLFDCLPLSHAGTVDTGRPVNKNRVIPRCDATYVRNQIRRVKDLGVRYVFPMHTTNNQFGGAAVYNEMFNFENYYLSGEFIELDNNPNACPDVEFQMGHLDGVVATALATKGYSYDVRKAPARGHCNNLGLTANGRSLIEELIQQHVIFDVDHMSQKSFYDTLGIAMRNGPYPLVSGHSGFRELFFSKAEVTRLAGGYSDQAVENIRHESMKSADMVARIRATGGMVAPILIPATSKKFGHVDNDCPGSSKSWAQSYLYAIDHMGRRGVALGSDLNGVTMMPGPRFGNQACKGVEHPDGTLLGVPGVATTTAEALAVRQNVGTRVSYASSAVSCGNDRFERTEDGHVRQGICTARSGRVDTHDAGHAWAQCGQQIPCTAGLCTLANDVCKGLAGATAWSTCAEQDRGRPFGWIEMYPAGEHRRGACIAGRRQPCPTTGDAEVIRACRLVSRLLPEFEVDPRGLPRVTAGLRDFDYNYDGFAHYGLLPDFIADLRAIGVTEMELDPIMHSAEDFVQLWEKIEGTRPRGPWQ